MSKPSIEQMDLLSLRYDRDGLVPVVTTDAVGGDVLMLAFMNAEALEKTLETGEAHYWSRSRGELWHKGATSGHIQKVIELRVDCDQDALWMRVEQIGPGCCHAGYRTCFYREVPVGEGAAPPLRFHEKEKSYDPASVYGKSSKS